ncbi:MAG: hypothetical protein ACFBQW_06205 [Sphingomonadaceae bacterium]
MIVIDTSALVAILEREPEADAPLLFKGNDFSRTDVRIAIPPSL